MTAKILFVLTNHDRLGPGDDATAAATGFHLTEAAHPWHILTGAGFGVDLVSPAGGLAPIDPSSRDDSDPVNQAFLADPVVAATLGSTRALRSVRLADYAAVYFPGGHGTMWDLPDSADVQHAVRIMFAAGKPVAAVCHGPAALVNVRLPGGQWLVTDRRLCAFTDAEERATAKDRLMPFSLASALVARGAVHQVCDNFAPCVAQDGPLITGQNPASAQGVGEALRDALKEYDA